MKQTATGTTECVWYWETELVTDKGKKSTVSSAKEEEASGSQALKDFRGKVADGYRANARQ